MKSIPPHKFSWVMGPRLTAVIMSGTMEEPDGMLASWVSPVSFSPPLLMVSVSEKRHTYKLIEKHREFAVSFFPKKFLDSAFYLGTHSGRNENKIKKLDLEVMKGEKTSIPLLKDCVSHIECRLHRKIKTGDHFLFIGEVVNVMIKEDAADNIAVNPKNYTYWRMSGSKEDTYFFK